MSFTRETLPQVTDATIRGHLNARHGGYDDARPDQRTTAALLSWHETAHEVDYRLLHGHDDRTPEPQPTRNAIRVKVPYVEAESVQRAAAALREIADSIERGSSWGSAAPNAPDGDPIRWHYDVKPILPAV